MKINLISFDTAKLAKSKGFNIPTRYFYADLSWNNKEIYKSNEVGYDEFTNSMENDHGFGDIILIPTQSILQKWLREVHKIYVNSKYDLTPDGKNILYFSNWGFINDPSSDNYKYNPNGGYDEKAIWKTYEEALEIGLQEALKLI